MREWEWCGLCCVVWGVVCCVLCVVWCGVGLGLGLDSMLPQLTELMRDTAITVIW